MTTSDKPLTDDDIRGCSRGPGCSFYLHQDLHQYFCHSERCGRPEPKEEKSTMARQPEKAVIASPSLKEIADRIRRLSYSDMGRLAEMLARQVNKVESGENLTPLSTHMVADALLQAADELHPPQVKSDEDAAPQITERSLDRLRGRFNRD